jgi:hypothetical protein
MTWVLPATSHHAPTSVTHGLGYGLYGGWLNLHGIVSESSCEFNGFTNHVGFIVVTTFD